MDIYCPQMYYKITYFFTSSDRELFECSDIIYE